MNGFDNILIDNLLKQKQSKNLFLTQAFDEVQFGRTVAALANDKGGDILIGVGDDKEIIGIVDNAEEVSERCMVIVRRDVSSDLPVNIQPIKYNLKNIILVSVWEGQKKPYLYRDDFYVLTNDVVKRASISQLNRLIMNSDSADKNWERGVVASASFDDLDLDEVRETIRMAKNVIRIDDDITPEAFLMRQGLVKNGMLTNACVMLFGKAPQQFIPQSVIRLSVFSDNESKQLIQTRLYTGNIFRNIKAIFSDFEDIYGTQVVISGLMREEKEAYPPIALREAVMNAIIHRDMSEPNSFITINIFASKTTISNSGQLMEGITTTSLKRQHNSVLRNPDMAYVCYLRQLMELAGSGTLRIVENCLANGFREPVWSCRSNVVSIVFPAIHPRLSSDSRMSGDMSRLAVSDSRGSDLQAIVDFIKEHPKAKTADILNVVKKSMPTLKRNLAYLKSTGVISFVGNNRNGGYVVNAE